MSLNEKIVRTSVGKLSIRYRMHRKFDLALDKGIKVLM